MDENGLGGLIFKTIMRDERDGNARPRLKDVFIDSDKGLVNALGLPGPVLKNSSKLSPPPVFGIMVDHWGLVWEVMK